MKESEHIRLESDKDTSDNDFRAFNYVRKIERAEAKEGFEENILPNLKDGVTYECKDDGLKYILFADRFGRMDFYPKSGSLYFHRGKNWMKRRGIFFIKKHLIKD